MTTPVFRITTCEGKFGPPIHSAFECRQESPNSPFELGDPFGLRKAILPVFRGDPAGLIYGIGTAFHIDGWGALMSADHVVDFLQGRSALTPHQIKQLDLRVDDHARVMLGAGLVYGAMNVGKDQFGLVTECWKPAAEYNDPMAALRGESQYRVSVDLCAMRAVFDVKAEVPASLAIRIHGWVPTIGDIVFAAGYPQLAPNEKTPTDGRQFIVDGLYGAYGSITKLWPDGRDRSNPSPVFEVEADWPSGMSGGPVFNQQGEVVGVVSRSLAPDGEKKGVGYAIWLSRIPEIVKMFPTLDLNNPGCRRGFGVIRDGENTSHLDCVTMLREKAERRASELGSAYRVKEGSHRIGTDEFM